MDELKNYLHASRARKETPQKEAAQLGNLLRGVFDRMAARSAKDSKLPGLSTGFWELDDMIGGMEQGELITVKGCQDVGVTAFLLNIVLNVAGHTDRPILIFTRQQSALQIARRLLSAQTQVSIRQIEYANLTDEQWNLLTRGSTWLNTRDIRIYDETGTVEEIRNVCEGAEDPALIIVDELPEEYTWAADQLFQLRQLAQKKQVPVLCACWLKDASDYSAAGVNKVLWLERKGGMECYYSDTEAVCHIERNTHGRNGRFDLIFQPDTLTFFSASQEENGTLPNE